MILVQEVHSHLLVADRTLSCLRLLHVLLEPFRTACGVEEMLAHRDLYHFGVLLEGIHAEDTLGKIELIVLSKFFIVRQVS